MKRILIILLMIFVYLYTDDMDYDKYKRSLKQKDYLSAKNYLLKIVNKTIYIGNVSKLQKLYHELANIYKIRRNYYKALEYFKLSLKLERSKKEPSKKEKLKLYRNLAFCYKQIGNTFEAFKSTYKATKIASKIFDPNSNIVKKLNKEVEKVQSQLIAASM